MGLLFSLFGINKKKNEKYLRYKGLMEDKRYASSIDRSSSKYYKRRQGNIGSNYSRF